MNVNVKSLTVLLQIECPECNEVNKISLDFDPSWPFLTEAIKCLACGCVLYEAGRNVLSEKVVEYVLHGRTENNRSEWQYYNEGRRLT